MLYYNYQASLCMRHHNANSKLFQLHKDSTQGILHSFMDSAWGICHMPTTTEYFVFIIIFSVKSVLSLIYE